MKNILSFEEYFKKINENLSIIQQDNRKEIDYYNIINPETGVRYDIPFLEVSDDEYVKKYSDFMKIKLEDEEKFKELLEWS